MESKVSLGAAVVAAVMATPEVLTATTSTPVVLLKVTFEAYCPAVAVLLLNEMGYWWFGPE